MFTPRKIINIAVALWATISLAGCGDDAMNPTAPHKDSFSPNGHTVSVAPSSALDAANLYLGRGSAGISQGNNGFAVGGHFFDANGYLQNEFFVNIPAAGDYIVAYHVKDSVLYFLMFRAEQPVLLHIGARPNDKVDAVAVLYGVTFLPEHALLLTTRIGDAWFLENYGISELDAQGDEIDDAVENYYDLDSFHIEYFSFGVNFDNDDDDEDDDDDDDDDDDED